MLIEAIGGVSRRLPRGRGRIGNALNERCRSQQVTYRDINGHVRTADLSDPMESQWFAGYRGIGLTAHELSYVHDGDFALDIGANIGIVSGQLVNRVGATGQVSAFEPIPRNIRKLEGLRDDNGLATLQTMPFAIGAVDGSQVIRIASDSNSGHASFTASWINGEELTVEVRKLDTVLAERGRKVSFIKIDIEGYEEEAIIGGERVLREDAPTVLVEVNLPILRDRGSSAAALTRIFEHVGYIPETRISDDGPSLVNALFVPRPT
jgi:FkbM family methyltransferase